MGRPGKEITVEGKFLQPAKRIKGEKWTQAEMETLISLCLSHGKSGILSKETNKATTAKKDMQWIKVQSVFNSVHPPRDKSALLARFKYILMHLRKDKARERLNTMKTGGGPRCVDEKMPFEVTGPMLELADVLGVSVSGLDGFGSDALSLLPNSSGATENASLQEMRDEPCSIQQTIDDLENLMTDVMEIQNTGSVEQGTAVALESADTEIEAVTPNDVDLPTTPFPGRLQFFPSTQKRQRKRKASSEEVNSSIAEFRKVYLIERDRREKEKHAAEMHFENAVLEAKLEEMRQTALDRQAERERRVELHAMEICHKKTVFNHQVKLMIAARNALACSCSSREVALRSVISLTMENDSCFSAGGHSEDESHT